MVEDLNGDGDFEDDVLHVLEFATAIGRLVMLRDPRAARSRIFCGAPSCGDPSLPTVTADRPPSSM